MRIQEKRGEIRRWTEANRRGEERSGEDRRGEELDPCKTTAEERVFAAM